MNQQKRVPTSGKWAKDLTHVRAEENSNGKPSPKGKVQRFFIPQTMRATREVQAPPRLPPADSTKGRQRGPRSRNHLHGLRVERVSMGSMEKTGAPSRKDGESLR